jgi:predicted ribosomally synthesized peptide with SipW-like signal peptide
MNTKKATKRALLTSVMALVMCVVMLVGTTFAWFTDTASTAVNKIQAGNLDVELLMYKKITDESYDYVNISKEREPIFDSDTSTVAQNNNLDTLWEPGKTQVAYLAIKNEGNLALKYKVALNVTNPVDGKDLYKVMQYAIVPNAQPSSAPTAWTTGSNVTVGQQPVSGEVSLAVGATHYFALLVHMDEMAGNEYKNGKVEFDLTVYATQDTVESDSFDNTYDENATYDAGAYGTGATIIGLDGTYDSLTAAAKAWRESKGVVTSGNTFGMNSLGGTVDSIAWVISGEVATGDGEGVIGNNGAGQSILGGGYFTPDVTVNNITIKGVNDAKIAKTGDSYLVSAAGKNVVYENITFVDTVRIDSNPANLTFKNCKFEAGLRMPHSAEAANVTIENCTFTGNESSGYAIFAQGNMANFTISGNMISNCQRGINVQAGNNAIVTIDGNTIKNIAGKTDGFTYGAAIQLTSAKTFTVTNNTISDVAVNAFHIYNGCAADSIVIKDNNISAKYLCWNQANYDMSKVASSGNTVSITNADKCVTKTEVINSTFTLN